MTEEDFLIIAPDPLVDWVSILMSRFYTMGSASQIRKYVPIIQTKDQIIDEKDELIEAQATHIVKLESQVSGLGSSNEVLRDDVEKYKGLYHTWRSRTFTIGGVSIGIIGVAGLTLWLIN
ncbi:MAG: hypothetical protein LC687_04895 [Actinobacteria bacterium]|nr:hypothetical protein [Actinomycetota bacterium]